MKSCEDACSECPSTPTDFSVHSTVHSRHPLRPVGYLLFFNFGFAFEILWVDDDYDLTYSTAGQAPLII